MATTNITLEELQAVDTKKLKGYIRKMHQSSIKWVEKNGGKAWIHPHVLADYGIKRDYWD